MPKICWPVHARRLDTWQPEGWSCYTLLETRISGTILIKGIISQNITSNFLLMRAEIGFHYQSCARDKTAATTWPYFQATKSLVIELLYYYTVFVVATPWSHRDLKIFHICAWPWNSITLLRCRCRKATKLSRAQLCSPRTAILIYILKFVS